MFQKLLSALFVVLVLTSCAHHKIVPVEERQVQFVHEVDLTKDQIFDRTLEWMAKIYVDLKSVLKVENRDSGQIVVKAVGSLDGAYGASFRYVLTLDVKDGRYRSTYSDFSIEEEPYVLKIKETLAKRYDMPLFLFLSKKNQDW